MKSKGTTYCPWELDLFSPTNEVLYTSKDLKNRAADIYNLKADLPFNPKERDVEIKPVEFNVKVLCGNHSPELCQRPTKLFLKRNHVLSSQFRLMVILFQGFPGRE